jgi:PKD repeat protein
MKQRILLIGFILLQFADLNVYGQLAITKNDTIIIHNDSLVLKINKVRGDVSWQFSKDALNWIDLKEVIGDSMLISKIDSSGFYRAKIVDGNCDPVFSDSISVKAHLLLGKLTLPIQNNNNIVIESLLDEAQPTLDNKFSIRTNSLVMATNKLLGKPIYFGFPETDEKANYQLNAKETALYFCLAAFPYIRRPIFAKNIKSIKDAMYNYPEVKVLEEKINKVIEMNGYLDMDQIGIELGNAIDKIILSFSINLEDQSVQSTTNQNSIASITQNSSSKSAFLVNNPTWNTKYQGWYRVQDEISDRAGDIYYEQTGEYQMRRSFYNQTPSVVGVIIGKYDKETDTAEPVGNYIGFINPYYPPNLLSIDGQIDNIIQFGTMTWDMITNGFLDALSQSDAFSSSQDLSFILKENEKDAFIFMNGYYDERIAATNVIYVFADILQDYLGNHGLVGDFTLYLMNSPNRDIMNYLHWWRQKNYDLIAENLKEDFLNFLKSDGYRILLSADKDLAKSVKDFSDKLETLLITWSSVYKHSAEVYKVATLLITSSSQNFGVSIPVSFEGPKNSKPLLNTRNISNLTESSVTLGGNIISTGGLPILASGVCWNTAPNPEVNDYTPRTNDWNNINSFISQISGLNSNTTYYARAFATNILGSGYGNQVIFTTKISTQPPIANFTASKTTINKGESIQFTDQSTNNPTSWLWDFGDGTNNTSQNPLKIYSQTGTYTISLKATNTFGINQVIKANYIKVNEVLTEPAVSTLSASNITETSVRLKGNVTSDGGATIIERGFYLSKTNTNPGQNDNKVKVSGTIGSFNKNLSGLQPNTTYYFRAYATNSQGTTDGNVEQFTTIAITNVRILFIRGTSIFSCGLDGSDEQLILSGITNAEKVNYGSDKFCYYNGSSMNIVDKNGGNGYTIPNTTDAYGECDISPDGTKIIYNGSNRNYCLLIINIDGSNKITFTNEISISKHQNYPCWNKPDLIFFGTSSNGNAQSQILYSKSTIDLQAPSNTLTSSFGQYPVFGGTFNKVIYNDLQGNLIIMNYDGTAKSNLTLAGTGNSAKGAWMDSENVFYYVKNGNIWKISSDNTNNTQITSSGDILRVLAVE